MTKASNNNQSFFYMQNGLRILYVHEREALLPRWNNSGLNGRTCPRVEEKILYQLISQRRDNTVLSLINYTTGSSF